MQVKCWPACRFAACWGLQATHNVIDEACSPTALLDLLQDAGLQAQAYLHKLSPGCWLPVDALRMPLQTLRVTQIMSGKAGQDQTTAVIAPWSASGLTDM